MKIDTVDFYFKTLHDKKERDDDRKMKYKPSFRCCGWDQDQGHNPECVNFQPEGETHTNRIVQHYPAYCTGFDVACVGFDTTEELLVIPFVKRFSEGRDDFFTYSISDNALMAEYKYGKEWWCIGRLRDASKVNLPKWIPIYEKNSDK